MNRALTFMILLGILVGCQSNSNLLENMIGPETSHLKGNSIGDSYSSVMANVESDSPIVEELSIICEYEEEGVEMTVAYEFDEHQLYSIQADLFFTVEPTLKTFEQQLSDRYTKMCGENTESGGFKVWQQQLSDSLKIEYLLADESIEFGHPKLSLTIYNFDY